MRALDCGVIGAPGSEERSVRLRLLEVTILTGI
jgi:hypothetical protein